MARRILIKILVAALVFVALDLVYRYTLYPAELQAKYPEAAQMEHSNGIADVYYFGESSNVTCDKADTNKKSISGLLGDFYPGLNIVNINKYATHAGVYRKWLEQIEVEHGKPSALIVTMNLRSFGVGWIQSDLETQLSEAFVLKRPLPALLNRFLLSLQVYDNRTPEERDLIIKREWNEKPLRFPFTFRYKTVEEWNRSVAWGGHLKEDGSWDMKKIELACHYIKSYAFNVDEENPRVKDFDAIARWCADRNVRCYFSLLSENTAYADSLVGRELVFLMRQNRDFLVNRYNEGNCTVIDNLELVDAGSFIDKTWTTEHYAFKGRLAIARNLARGMKKQYIVHFKNVY